MQRILALAVLATLAAALATGVGARPPASSFSAHVDNPWFPLKPGTRYVYTGRQGRTAVTRRGDRDAPDEDDRRRAVRRRRGSPLPPRPARGAHDRLVLTGRPRQRLVLRRADGRARPPRSRHEHGGHMALGCRRRARRHLHARPPARRPDRAAGVLQGSCRGSLQGDRALRHSVRAPRYEERAARRRRRRRSSPARSTTSCTSAASASCSSRPSAAATSETSSSPSRTAAKNSGVAARRLRCSCVRAGVLRDAEVDHVDRDGLLAVVAREMHVVRGLDERLRPSRP